MKKNIFTRVLVLALVLALQVSAVAYAEEGTGESGITQENPTEESKEEESKEEEPEVQVPEKGNPGWYQEPSNNDWYYYDASGLRAEGWRWVNNAWYYLDGSNEKKPGVMVSNCKMTIKGATYFFNTLGAMETGWVLRPEGWYYTNSDGAMYAGWLQWKNTWYYLDGNNEENPGLMAVDRCKASDGKMYFFRASGAMETGWVLREEGWYYTESSGAMVTGWRKVGNYWYYLDGENVEYPGLMIHDCEREINGQSYLFYSNGAMRSGWCQDEEGYWYYYGIDSGVAAVGWQYIGNVWYYFDSENMNRMAANGWYEIDGNWYYLYSSGAMASNWLSLGGEWYYLGSDGAMKTGWQLVGGKWYYMYLENDPHGGRWGVMARNTTIDGWRLQADGSMITGEQANMALKAQMYGSSTNYLILVNRSACKVAIFSGRSGAWNMIQYWSCAPGKPSTPTVAGTFRVQSKGYYFDSGSSRCYWYTQFYGNYLFHSVLYNKYTGALADGRVGMQLSHGCVRLEIGNAKWIYDNIPQGTTVVVY